MTHDERIELLVPYLRGLSATMSDDYLGDAADLIEELAGVIVGYAQNGVPTSEEVLPPSSSVSTPTLQPLPRVSTLNGSTQLLWANRPR